MLNEDDQELSTNDDLTGEETDVDEDVEVEDGIGLLDDEEDPHKRDDMEDESDYVAAIMDPYEESMSY